MERLCSQTQLYQLICFNDYTRQLRGTAVAQWLRCCATNQKVAGSIPDGAIGIFHWHNPSDRTMALGSTQPQGWQPYHHPVPLSCNLLTLTSWNPLGHSRSVMGLILHPSLTCSSLTHSPTHSLTHSHTNTHRYQWTILRKQSVASIYLMDSMVHDGRIVWWRQSRRYVRT